MRHSVAGEGECGTGLSDGYPLTVRHSLSFKITTVGSKRQVSLIDAHYSWQCHLAAIVPVVSKWPGG